MHQDTINVLMSIEKNISIAVVVCHDNEIVVDCACHWAGPVVCVPSAKWTVPKQHAGIHHLPAMETVDRIHKTLTIYLGYHHINIITTCFCE